MICDNLASIGRILRTTLSNIPVKFVVNKLFQLVDDVGKAACEPTCYKAERSIIWGGGLGGGRYS